MSFPLSPNDFLPLHDDETKSKNCEYKKRPFRVSVTRHADGDYFLEIISVDKSIEDITGGHDKNLLFLWDLAVINLEKTLNG